RTTAGRRLEWALDSQVEVLSHVRGVRGRHHGVGGLVTAHQGKVLRVMLKLRLQGLEFGPELSTAGGIEKAFARVDHRVPAGGVGSNRFEHPAGKVQKPG